VQRAHLKVLLFGTLVLKKTTLINMTKPRNMAPMTILESKIHSKLL